MPPFPLILGHRGASTIAPENTLAAFSRAIEDGADGIEFDVRLSLDHVPVVIHDDSLKRTGLKDQLVSATTADELMRADVGSWFDRDPSFAGERLPSLRAVLELFKTLESVLYVEMKCDAAEAKALAREVVRLVKQNKMTERVVIESFDLSGLEAVKQFDPAVRTAALFEPKLTSPLTTLRRFRMIEQAQRCQADEIAFHHTLAGPRIVEKAIGGGLDVVLWTVDDPAWVERAQKLGIKALISNNPGQMVCHRAKLLTLEVGDST
jgi:glycerophosphoryl diester phosphodiesterase